jgi:hypothetical protein
MERQQKDWNEIKDILIYTSVRSPKPFAVVYQDSIIQVSWTANTSDHDSIIIQQKLGTQQHFSTVATLASNTTTLNIEKPATNKYYDFRIIAHYTDTTDLYSQPVRVFFPEWTRPTRTPFNDTLHVIPGIIEAEDFDKGGEGFTYHDSNELNIPGDYRPEEGVDIFDRLGDGFHIGNVMPGEWTEYSVNVLSEGWYNISAYVATFNAGGTFKIEVDTVSSGTITVSASGSPLNTVPVTTKMYLYAGKQIFRFTIIDGPQFNIDQFEFELITNAQHPATQKELGFTLYQNQTKELVINQKTGTQLVQLNVYNLNGKIIKIISDPGPTEKIAGSEFSTGLYIVKGFSENGIYTKKIVIK